MDPFVIAAAVDLHQRSEADFTTNLLPRTYPRGLDVEVLSARTLRMAELEAAEGAERDGVTTFVVRRPERFRLANLTSGHSLGQEQWAVETPEGLDRMREIVRLLPDPTTASWNRILAVVGRTAKPRPGQIVLRPIDDAEPGSSPWVRTWAVDVDGRTVGTASVSAGNGRSERHVRVTGEWVEPTREALYRLLLDDPQIAP